MKVKVKKLVEDAVLPTYATEGSGCFDIYSLVDTYVSKGDPQIISTGLSFEIPENHVMLIFSRSGDGFKRDIRLSNCVGVIDSDYRGELLIKMTRDENLHGDHEGKVKYLDRVAQGLIIPIPKVEFEEAEELSDTERGHNGFGSTGT